MAETKELTLIFPHLIPPINVLAISSQLVYRCPEGDSALFLFRKIPRDCKCPIKMTQIIADLLCSAHRQTMQSEP